MRLHHVGIVVESLAAHGQAYGKFLGLSADSPVYHDPIQKVHVQFWKDAGGNLLELIEPAGPDSPVARVLKKGGGLSHLCYEVEDFDEEVRLALEKGAIPAGEVAPAMAFSGRRVAFLFFPKMNLVEFVEAASK
jgi:methylmalonyl-CoA/ethylmalonyl-CoA epimerase